jgi:glycine dehydrogenase subunit 2
MSYNFLMNESVAKKSEAFNFIHQYQQAARAHGEFTRLLIVVKYFKPIKQKRTKIIVPDTAHGTNLPSAAFASFGIVPLKSESNGSTYYLKN